MMNPLTIIKINYLDFVEPSRTCSDYFLKQINKICKVVPEFVYQPIFYIIDGLLCYDNNHFFDHDDNIGRFKVRFESSYFGFNDDINKFESIEIDCESFGIKKVTRNKICKMAGVPAGYISKAEQQRIDKAEQQRIDKAEQQRIKDIKTQYSKLNAELKLLEAELK